MLELALFVYILDGNISSTNPRSNNPGVQAVWIYMQWLFHGITSFPSVKP